MKKKKLSPSKDEGYENLILALETATAVSSAAIFEGEQLLGHVAYHTQRTHARLLTVMVERLLADLDLQPSQLSAIGISGGPGSYTGLRVGVSTAKGLAMALDKPLLAISSLEALAWTVQDFASAQNALICPMIDARRMEAYTAVFSAEVEEIRSIQAQIIEEDAFSEILSQQKVVFCGDGAAKCKTLLEAQSSNAIVLDERLSSAAFMGKPLFKKFQQGQFEDLIHYEPFYLKDFVASISRKKLL